MNFSLHPAHSISCQKKRRSESHRENAQNPEPCYFIKCMMNVAITNVICEQLQIIPISGHKKHSSNNAHLHQLWCLRSLQIIHPEESYNRPLWKTLAFAAHQTIHRKKIILQTDRFHRALNWKCNAGTFTCRTSQIRMVVLNLGWFSWWI